MRCWISLQVGAVHEVSRTGSEKQVSVAGTIPTYRHSRPTSAYILNASRKLDFQISAKPKIGSMDNASHKPLGGDKKVNSLAPVTVPRLYLFLLKICYIMLVLYIRDVVHVYVNIF